MDHNYYEPTIDDFCLGYKMETCSWLAKNDKGDWEEYVIEDLDFFLSVYIGDLYPTEFRVKQLNN